MHLATRLDRYAGIVHSPGPMGQGLPGPPHGACFVVFIFDTTEGDNTFRSPSVILHAYPPWTGADH